MSDKLYLLAGLALAGFAVYKYVEHKKRLDAAAAAGATPTVV